MKLFCAHIERFKGGIRQTSQVSRVTRDSHGCWQFLKAHGRETQCSRIFVNLTEQFSPDAKWPYPAKACIGVIMNSCD